MRGSSSAARAAAVASGSGGGGGGGGAADGGAADDGARGGGARSRGGGGARGGFRAQLQNLQGLQATALPAPASEGESAGGAPRRLAANIVEMFITDALRTGVWG
eukprot:scaffold76746_cov77-Phaeocystis_antarctica.AAC.2